MSFIENYWFAILLGVVLLVWGWRLWRRANRPPPQ